MSTLTQQDPLREADGRQGQAEKPTLREARMESPARKEKKTYVFRDVVTLSRNFSNKQFDPNEETHREAIERMLPRSNYPRTKFLFEFGKDTERVLDSKRFETDCRNRRLDPRVVAQHVVFAGDKYIKAVVAKGIEVALGSLIVDMTKPIFEVSEIELVLRNQLGVFEGIDSSVETAVKE